MIGIAMLTRQLVEHLLEINQQQQSFVQGTCDWAGIVLTGAGHQVHD
jgi:hypothetical protein